MSCSGSRRLADTRSTVVDHRSQIAHKRTSAWVHRAKAQGLDGPDGHTDASCVSSAHDSIKYTERPRQSFTVYTSLHSLHGTESTLLNYYFVYKSTRLHARCKDREKERRL